MLIESAFKLHVKSQHFAFMSFPVTIETLLCLLLIIMLLVLLLLLIMMMMMMMMMMPTTKDASERVANDQSAEPASSRAHRSAHARTVADRQPLHLGAYFVSHFHSFVHSFIHSFIYLSIHPSIMF